MLEFIIGLVILRFITKNNKRLCLVMLWFINSFVLLWFINGLVILRLTNKKKRLCFVCQWHEMVIFVENSGLSTICTSILID